MEFLKITGVGKTENGNAVVSNIDLRVSRHHNIAIAGETGSGKSTLLKIIGGLAQADSGEVRFEGVRVEGPAEKLIPGHPGVAYLSQQYELPNNMWVEEVLEYADDLPAGEAAILYKACRIGHLLKRRTNQLSGGEKQRIALARLLTRMPGLLLLDEPFSNLDPIHKSILKSVLEDISRKLGTTCILASHDPVDTLSWADEIVVIRSGKLVQQGQPSIVYSKPADAYVAGLFGAYNFIPRDAAPLFYPLSSIEKNRAIFFRPEEIKPAAKAADTLEATVERISFMGAYHEIELSLQGLRLIMRLIHHAIKIGDRIHLSFNTDRFWYW